MIQYTTLPLDIQFERWLCIQKWISSHFISKGEHNCSRFMTGSPSSFVIKLRQSCMRTRHNRRLARIREVRSEISRASLLLFRARATLPWQNSIVNQAWHLCQHLREVCKINPNFKRFRNHVQSTMKRFHGTETRREISTGFVNAVFSQFLQSQCCPPPTSKLSEAVVYLNKDSIQNSNKRLSGYV